MREFWVSSGHHLTHRAANGWLAVTDELLLAYLARPELVPPPEACAAERALHASLLGEPRRPVRAAEIDALSDPDARENWRVMVAFRDRLLAAGTIEAAYLDFARRGADGTPALFLSQLVHLVLRNALDGSEDAYVLRAAELFFRPQRVSFVEKAVLLADAEVVEGRHNAPPSPLHVMLGKEAAPDLDVIGEDNGWTYWSRSDAFTMVLNIGSDPKAREAFARVVERWIGHLLHLEVRVEPIARIEDEDWRWFVGLDAEGTRLGNALWRGERVSPETQGRLLGLFRLAFRDGERVEEAVAGRPVYLFSA